MRYISRANPKLPKRCNGNNTKWTRNSNLIPTYSGSKALECILRFISYKLEKQHITVGVQRFTCQSVIDVLSEMKCKITFFDIDRLTLQLDIPNEVSVDVLIVTHIFGNLQYVNKLVTCKFIVNDFCHSLDPNELSRPLNKDHFNIYSFAYDKPISMWSGGAVKLADCQVSEIEKFKDEYTITSSFLCDFERCQYEYTLREMGVNSSFLYLSKKTTDFFFRYKLMRFILLYAKNNLILIFMLRVFNKIYNFFENRPQFFDATYKSEYLKQIINDPITLSEFYNTRQIDYSTRSGKSELCICGNKKLLSLRFLAYTDDRFIDENTDLELGMSNWKIPNLSPFEFSGTYFIISNAINIPRNS